MLSLICEVVALEVWLKRGNIVQLLEMLMSESASGC